jgi:hypothetical protein
MTNHETVFERIVAGHQTNPIATEAELLVFGAQLGEALVWSLMTWIDDYAEPVLLFVARTNPDRTDDALRTIAAVLTRVAAIIKPEDEVSTP